MTWPCCKNGWCKDSKEVTGMQTRRREKERYRLKWTDSVQLDLRNMSAKQCRTRTLNRTEWASVKREAKAKNKGLQLLKKKKKKNVKPQVLLLPEIYLV